MLSTELLMMAPLKNQKRNTQEQSSTPKAAANQSHTGPAAMPQGVQAKMEQNLSADFSDVSIHQNSSKATSLGAYAYTQGNDVHFAPGQFDPMSSKGQELIGHELAHVMQQRDGKVKPTTQAKGLPVNDDEGLETEADQLGAKAAQTPFSNVVSQQAPTAQMKTAGTVQMWNPFKKKKKANANVDGKTYNNPTNVSVNATHSANPTKKVEFAENIGNTGTNMGFFKGDTGIGAEAGGGFEQGIQVSDPFTMESLGPARSAARAVASSRLDKALGMNIISEEHFAEVDGEKGSISGAVDGKQMISEKDDGGYSLNHFDMKKGNTQKGLSDLQLFDFLTNQTDRHGGNIFINDSGDVKGIDNDVSFGNINPKGMDMEATQEQRRNEGKLGPEVGKHNYLGLPSQIDKGTAEKVLKMKAKNLGKVLNDPTKGADEQLTAEEIKAAQIRFRHAKAHIKGLKKSGGLVEKWDDSTYEKMSGDVTEGKAYNPNTQEMEDGKQGNNYMSRHEAFRENAPVNAPNAMKDATIEPAPAITEDAIAQRLDPRMARIMNFQEREFRGRNKKPSAQDARKQNMDNVLKEAFPFY